MTAMRRTKVRDLEDDRHSLIVETDERKTASCFPLKALLDRKSIQQRFLALRV